MPDKRKPWEQKETLGGAANRTPDRLYAKEELYH
jgi:hypothetical protein